MSYKVVVNGLLGKQTKPGYSGITKEQLTEAVEHVFRETPIREMRIPVYTGTRGREQFEEAFQREINEQLWHVEPISMETLDRGTFESFRRDFLNFSVEEPNIQRIQRSQQTDDLNAMRLQRGEITPVEYLDLLSEEETTNTI